jgi:uncharacterized membrane protein YphA (DoxX/SURF4 family)
VSLGDGDFWQHIGTLSDTDEQGDGSIVAQPGEVQSTLGYGILALRLTMGWVLRQSGLTKLVTYLDGNPETDWTAAGYLAEAIPEGNPFMGTWQSMAGLPLAHGGVITHLAYRAYRRTRSPVMCTFAAGFALVTPGLLFCGASHQLLGLDLAASLLPKRLLTVAGFGLLVYSLYGHFEESGPPGGDRSPASGPHSMVPPETQRTDG